MGRVRGLQPVVSPRLSALQRQARAQVPRDARALPALRRRNARERGPAGMSTAQGERFPAERAGAFHGGENRGTRPAAEAFHRGNETDVGGGNALPAGLARARDVRRSSRRGGVSS